jgi:hypothetical protein
MILAIWLPEPTFFYQITHSMPGSFGKVLDYRLSLPVKWLILTEPLFAHQDFT